MTVETAVPDTDKEGDVSKRVAMLILGVLLLTSASTTVAMAESSFCNDRQCTACLAAPEEAGSSNTLLAVSGSVDGRPAFPQSGTQIVIAAVVVVILLIGGITLWYFSHPRKRKPQDTPSDRSDDKS